LLANTPIGASGSRVTDNPGALVLLPRMLAVLLADESCYERETYRARLPEFLESAIRRPTHPYNPRTISSTGHRLMYVSDYNAGPHFF
jgi:hypothetical protein